MNDLKALIRIRRKVEHATQLAQQKMDYNLLRLQDPDATGDGQPIAGYYRGIKPGTKTVRIDIPVVVGQFSDCYPASVGADTAELVLPTVLADARQAAMLTRPDVIEAANVIVEPVNLASLRRVQAIRAQQDAIRNSKPEPRPVPVQTAQRPEERVQAILSELFPDGKKSRVNELVDNMESSGGRP